MEGGQHDLARAAVVLAVGRQQAVAEERDEVAHAALAPAEVVGVGDGHVVVGLRAEHEHAGACRIRIEKTGPCGRRRRAAAAAGCARSARAGDAEVGRAGGQPPFSGALVAQVRGEPRERPGDDRWRSVDGHGAVSATAAAWLAGQPDRCARGRSGRLYASAPHAGSSRPSSWGSPRGSPSSCRSPAPRTCASSPRFAGWEDPGAAFTAVIQLGTMAAVLIYFRTRPVGRSRARGWLSLRRPELRRRLDARHGLVPDHPRHDPDRDLRPDLQGPDRDRRARPLPDRQRR